MTRILLYTGKGGVGKTSIAAATGVACAARGIRTLVVSTDIAHSLGDALDVPVGPEPTAITDNLWAHEPDVFFNISKYWKTIQSYVSSLFAWGGLDEVMAEEMTVLPGMDELGNLLWIADHVDRGTYDLIVVDAAPTGETLRLLSLPEASRWWIERIAPIGKRVQKLGGPILRRVVGVPLPNEDVYESAEELLERLRYVHELLSNPESSSVRLVINLEKVAIQEAQRSFTYFHLYGYPTDLIVANRVLPAGAGPYFDAWREAQARYLPMVQEQFAPVPVRTVPSSTARWSAWSASANWPTHCSATPTHPSSYTADGLTGCRTKVTSTSCRSSCPSLRRRRSAFHARPMNSCCRLAAGAVTSSCRAFSSTPRPRVPRWRTASSRSDLASR
jgi:arsenite-transporting ATPase